MTALQLGDSKVRVGVSRGGARSSRKMPSQCSQSQWHQRSAAWRASHKGLAHTATMLSTPLSLSPPPPQSQQKAEHQNSPEKSCWTRQGKERGVAAKRGSALTPLRMSVRGLSPQPHKSQGSRKQSGPLGDTDQDSTGTRSVAFLSQIKLTLGVRRECPGEFGRSASG